MGNEVPSDHRDPGIATEVPERTTHHAPRTTLMTWQSLIESGLVRTNVALDRITTYKLGGAAEMMVEVGAIADLDRIAAALDLDPRPVLVLGRGSNLVISDDGLEGLVVRLGPAFTRIAISETVYAGGAAGMPKVARAASKAGQLGLEFLVGIPGSVGGGVRQNAGCFGQEMKDVLLSAAVYDLGQGAAVSRDLGALELSYRRSAV